MTIKEAQGLLSGVFVDRGKDGNGVQLEGLCFADDYMRDQDEDKQNIYRAVSNAQRDSELTFSFSYEVASKAVDILAGLEDWDNEEALHEAIDAAIPVYNGELMQIYLDNWHVVDDACEEMEEGSEASAARAQVGWYVAIRDMVHAIKSNIENICEEN